MLTKVRSLFVQALRIGLIEEQGAGTTQLDQPAHCGGLCGCGSTLTRPALEDGGHASVFHHEGSFLPPRPELIVSTAAAATHWPFCWPVVSRSDCALLSRPLTPP